MDLKNITHFVNFIQNTNIFIEYNSILVYEIH